MESGRRASWEDPAGFQSDAGGGTAERRRKMRVCLLFQVLSNFRKPHFSFHFGFKKQNSHLLGGSVYWNCLG